MIASGCPDCNYLWTVKKRMHKVAWQSRRYLGVGGKGIFDMQEKGVLRTRLLGSQLTSKNITILSSRI